MTEKEIKLFTVFLQKIDKKIWTDKMDRLLWYLIWTFHKQYDKEEERDSIIETTTDYLSGWAEYIDKEYVEDKEYEERTYEQRKAKEEIINNLIKMVNYCQKNNF